MSIDEATLWHTLVTRPEQSKLRPYSGAAVSKEEAKLHTLRLPPTELRVRETRCRAMFKIRYDPDKNWQRCRNIAYLDAFVDPDELYESSPLVALCYVHAAVCLRGNLWICR